MTMMTPTATQAAVGGKPVQKKASFAERQALAKQKAYERAAHRKTIKLAEVTAFTQQLSSMLQAGLPLSVPEIVMNK